MPTVLRADGLRVVVYLNDHAPEHVHVVGPGWVVVVDLIGLEVREAVGDPGARDIRRALRLVADHREALLDAWEDIHGD